MNQTYTKIIFGVKDNCDDVIDIKIIFKKTGRDVGRDVDIGVYDSKGRHFSETKALHTFDYYVKSWIPEIVYDDIFLYLNGGGHDDCPLTENRNDSLEKIEMDIAVFEEKLNLLIQEKIKIEKLYDMTE